MKLLKNFEDRSLKSIRDGKKCNSKLLKLETLRIALSIKAKKITRQLGD